ncbi:MAG: hypothetical protein RsTaC01_0504 [Candidatus Paraimprobicoccus trichonymphae]|uniref:Uncharacterized protein n=1 Tax=Candidatus Paraimprobicoccus trichonymphae TaxID=3033793 RepID=A0AA48KZW0_9FIRM|nr:MAG: hypothetical protein RsTaC01_0504 [Candidatus Paraimprobicoccus trichonymphae]
MKKAKRTIIFILVFLIFYVSIYTPNNINFASEEIKLLSSVTINATVSSFWTDDDKYDTTLYNTLISSNYETSYATEENSLIINNAMELAAFSKAVNEGEKTFENKFIKLASDINLQGTAPNIIESKSSDTGSNFGITIDGALENVWKPIGKNEPHQFSGTFDGNNHKIISMVVCEKTDDNYAGFFGCLADSGKLKNIGIDAESCVISFNSAHTGGLCGSSNGNISDSYAIEDIFVQSSSNSYLYAGGLCGISNGSISSSYATGDIFVQSSSNSYLYAGGLCGISNGSISSSYATGDVFLQSFAVYAGGLCGYSNSSVNNSYAIGDVTVQSSSYSYAYVGGLCGSSNGSLSDSYATGDVTVQSSNSPIYAGGLCGSSTDSLSDSCATGGVTVQSSYAYAYVGGLCGSSTDSLSNSYATGDVLAHSSNTYVYAGGLCGAINRCNMAHNYTIGRIAASGFPSYAGGISGNYTSTSVIQNNYYNAEISETKQAVGKDTTEKIEISNPGLTTVHMTGIGIDRATEKMTGLSENNWQFNNDEQIEDCVKLYYPNLKNVSVSIPEAQSDIDTQNPTIDGNTPSIKTNDKIYTIAEWEKNGNLSNNDVTLEYKVSDTWSGGEFVSGIDSESYYISLDRGENYYTSPTGITINNKSESGINFTINTEGEYEVNLKVSDKKGNTSESGPITIKIDKTIPPATVNINSSALVYSNVNTPLISGNGETGCTVNIRKGSDELASVAVISESWSVSLPKLSDGTHILNITQTDSAGNVSLPVEITVKIDTQTPNAEISIQANYFTSFFNNITFGMFFKNTIDVTINASDSLSGISKIEYLKSNIIYNDLSSMISQGVNWIDGGEIINNNISFNTAPPENQENEKFLIYAKITDNAGNVGYINTDGICFYTDSAQTTETIDFKKNSINDISVNVVLNGNTIDKILNDTTELANGTDYIINNSIIIFKSSYLNSLPQGNYILTIYYNPAGEIFALGEEPTSVSVSLKIDKAVQDDISIKNLNSFYTYGDDQVNLEVEGGNGTGEVKYESSDEEVAAIENNKSLKIKKVGTFNITVTKSENEFYSERSFTSNKLIVKPKLVEIMGIESENKIYDSNNSAVIKNSAKAVLTGKLNEDDLNINIGNALFDDKNAGNNKRVNFSGFSLSGFSIENYNLLEQPKSVKSNINPQSIYITEINSESKIYDGKDDAKITGNGVINGKITDDDLNIIYGDANFSDKNVGNEKNVNFTNFDLSGNDSANYNLVSQPSSVNKNILPKDLTLKVIVNYKLYDGTNKAEYFTNPTLNNVLENDKINLLPGIPTFSSIEISKDIPIDFTKFLITGEDSKNYNLIQPDSILADIAKDTSTNKVDSETGIWIQAGEYVLPLGSKLIVKEIESGSSEYEEILESMSENTKSFTDQMKIVEIHVEDLNGVIIQPNGDVTVRIPLPEGMDLGNIIMVYRIESGSDDVEIKGKSLILNNAPWVEYKITNHFSPYAVLDTKIKADENQNKSIIYLSTGIMVVVFSAALWLYLRKTGFNLFRAK